MHFQLDTSIFQEGCELSNHPYRVDIYVCIYIYTNILKNKAYKFIKL
jgi:hypothetical protein